MKIDSFVETDILFQIYGSLLTSRQREIMTLYYDEDFSLSEIGENLKISKQAVHDAIKRADKVLYEYEEKLSIYFDRKKREADAERMFELISSLPETEHKNEIEKIKDILKEWIE